jgi:hypothetical protein
MEGQIQRSSPFYVDGDVVRLSDSTMLVEVKNEADAELSGVPKVFEVKSGGTSYFFKAYPTKT